MVKANLQMFKYQYSQNFYAKTSTFHKQRLIQRLHLEAEVGTLGNLGFQSQEVKVQLIRVKIPNLKMQLKESNGRKKD